MSHSLTTAAAAMIAISLGMCPAASAEPQAGPIFSLDFPSSPVSQQNAVRAAEDYLEVSAFSRKGLVDQLEYSGYSTEDALFAVDSITVDWNAQAVRAAKDYLEVSAFSRSALIDQLVYSGFTPSQAAYGVAFTGL
jgi:hypothetical protein